MEKKCAGMYGDNRNGICWIMAYEGEVMCIYRYGDRCDNEKRNGKMARNPVRPETYGLGKKMCERLVEK